MARLYFHLCTHLCVQLLLTYIRALSSMVITHICPSAPAMRSHRWPRDSLVIPTSLWHKSYLQLSKCLENAVSSSSAWCISSLNTELEKIKYKLSIICFIPRKVWLVGMRSEEGNFKLESRGLVSALCSWNYINWKYLCVLEMHLKVPRAVFTEMEFGQHCLCQRFISLRRCTMCF